jgi:hypothetical protein
MPIETVMTKKIPLEKKVLVTTSGQNALIFLSGVEWPFLVWGGEGAVAYVGSSHACQMRIQHTPDQFSQKDQFLLASLLPLLLFYLNAKYILFLF